MITSRRSGRRARTVVEAPLRTVRRARLYVNRPPHRQVPVKGRAPLAALILAALMAPIAVWAYRNFLRNK